MYEATITVDTRLKTTAKPSACAPSLDDRQHAALALFCRALDEVNRLERRPVCSAIEYVMQQLQPDFALTAGGCVATIDALAALAASRGLVRLATVGGETLVQRKCSENGSPSEAAAREQTPAPALYRETLEGKLKCALPPAPVRQRVYAEAAAILAIREKDESPISLLDLSYRVDGRMERRIGQRSVFKLLLALVFANAFVIARNQRLHKIGILARLEPVEHWDDLFVESCLVGLRHDRPVWPLQADLLASVLDTSSERLRHLLHGNTRAPAAG